MNASSLTPPSRRSQAPAPRGPSHRPSRTRRLVGCALVVVAAGCSNDPVEVATPSTAPRSALPSSAPPTPDSQAAVLAQYRLFWSSLTSIQRKPEAERRAALAALAVNPALESLLNGMASADAKGQQFYGANVPRAASAQLTTDGLRAVVDDCQDSSDAGLAERSTGKPVTVGVDRSHVVVTLQRAEGRWKVSFVSYPKTPC